MKKTIAVITDSNGLPPVIGIVFRFATALMLLVPVLVLERGIVVVVVVVGAAMVAVAELNVVHEDDASVTK